MESAVHQKLRSKLIIPPKGSKATSSLAVRMSSRIKILELIHIKFLQSSRDHTIPKLSASTAGLRKNQGSLTITINSIRS